MYFLTILTVLDNQFFSIVSKIRQDTGVSVSIPADDSHSDEVRLEGHPDGVAKAKMDIMDIVTRMVMNLKKFRRRHCFVL